MFLFSTWNAARERTLRFPHACLWEKSEKDLRRTSRKALLVALLQIYTVPVLRIILDTVGLWGRQLDIDLWRELSDGPGAQALEMQLMERRLKAISRLSAAALSLQCLRKKLLAKIRVRAEEVFFGPSQIFPGGEKRICALTLCTIGYRPPHDIGTVGSPGCF